MCRNSSIRSFVFCSTLSSVNAGATDDVGCGVVGVVAGVDDDDNEGDVTGLQGTDAEAPRCGCRSP